MEIKQQIRDYINKNLILFSDDESFSDEDDIFKMGFVNSLFAMKLLTYIETEFKIIVENEEMDISNFNSVINIVNFIINKKKEL